MTLPGRPRPRASAPPPGRGLVIASESAGGAETVEVELIGVLYDVTPPKAASAMRIAWLAADKNADPDEVMRALDGWIEKAFGDQADDVRRRLYEDDDDPLDFPHIMLLIQRLVERASGLPTTRR